MSKISHDAGRAFEENKNFKRANTQVISNAQGTKLYLHGNLIARESDGIREITTSGWHTVTTLSRLNTVSKSKRVRTRKGELYIGEEMWNGEWRIV